MPDRPTPDPAPEDRLRERLASYGSALDAAATQPPARRRHLIAVDGPVPGGRRRSPWQGPVARAAAVVVVLGALVGSTWAATRSRDASTTATTERGWADGDVVRPEDRPAAYAALDGTWPLPTGGSLRFVLDRPQDADTTFAAFRRQLADDATCLWFRHVLEDPDLSTDERLIVEDIPTWPGHTTPPAPSATGPDDAGSAEPSAAGSPSLQELVEAALAGDTEVLRRHLSTACEGTSVGLGLPDVDGGWLLAGGSSSSAGVVGSTTASALDPTTLPGWARIAERLGPDVRPGSALALGDGAYNVALLGPATFTLTVERLDGPVTLPVSPAELERGTEVRDGVEVFVGAVDDGTVAHAVGSDGASIALTFRSSPASIEDLLGDIADLAADLHTAAWPG